jgi:spore coat polysaccharide biosynthesis protein SpsF
MRTEIFVQARMGSTRLPGKVLKPVLNKPLLGYLIERLQDAKEVDEIVVLTTIESQDDQIETFCQKFKIPCFRGSQENVLERYYQAAQLRNVDLIIRITADCPLIDPAIIDQLVRLYKNEFPRYDYISNGLKRTFPRGLDVEVFSFEALKKTFEAASSMSQKEHVTPFIYQHPELFKLRNVEHIPSLQNYRWTVDTPEDFELIRLILEHLYPIQPKFRLNDILNLLEEHKSWNQINAHIEQKKIN